MTELMGPKMPFRSDRPRRVQWWSFHRSGEIKGVVTSGDGQADHQQDSAGTDHPREDEQGDNQAHQRG